MRALIETRDRLVLRSEGADGNFIQTDLPFCIRQHEWLLDQMGQYPSENTASVLSGDRSNILRILECRPYNIPSIVNEDTTADKLPGILERELDYLWCNQDQLDLRLAMVTSSQLGAKTLAIHIQIENRLNNDKLSLTTI